MQIEIKIKQENSYTMNIKFEHKSWRSPAVEEDYASERLLFPPKTELQHVLSKLKEDNIVSTKNYQSMPDGLAEDWQVKQNTLSVTGNKQTMVNILFLLYRERYINDDEFKKHRQTISPEIEEPQHCCVIL